MSPRVRIPLCPPAFAQPLYDEVIGLESKVLEDNMGHNSETQTLYLEVP